MEMGRSKLINGVLLLILNIYLFQRQRVGGGRNRERDLPSADSFPVESRKTSTWEGSKQEWKWRWGTPSPTSGGLTYSATCGATMPFHIVSSWNLWGYPRSEHTSFSVRWYTLYIFWDMLPRNTAVRAPLPLCLACILAVIHVPSGTHSTAYLFPYNLELLYYFFPLQKST